MACLCMWDKRLWFPVESADMFFGLDLVLSSLISFSRRVPSALPATRPVFFVVADAAGVGGGEAFLPLRLRPEASAEAFPVYPFVSFLWCFLENISKWFFAVMSCTVDLGATRTFFPCFFLSFAFSPTNLFRCIQLGKRQSFEKKMKTKKLRPHFVELINSTIKAEI